MNEFRQQLVAEIAVPTQLDEVQTAAQLLTEDKLEEAEKLIKRGVALSWIETVPPYYYLWGQLAERQGNTALASENYERAIAASEAIRTDYANLVAQRQPLAMEHPFCLMMPYPAEYLSKPALALAQLKLAEHEPREAMRIYQKLLRYEPFQPLARQKLAEISTEGSADNP
jgi:tetratricopeptide (TPR) repeat protein